ncbi:hypothetical protein [Actinoplanes sp. RD1]|uniref:hypothetical protein n=1 Tax=Actinoplanes sp. RD1 TaxID=3064538 RepID=UPI002740D726|nr:hypothetical protein [Actinoplanes sp. RD1]
MNPTSLDLGGEPLPEPEPLIREWHAMSSDEQTETWQDLVDWVIWIHDLYELSREERLPLCWPQHPGLVEELRSLKVWREQIYDNPDAASAPHSARSWHGELRQSITAAVGFYAPSCRSGHTDAALFADTHPDLAEKWRGAAPPVMASAPALPTIAEPEVTVMSAQDMHDALTAGTARRHSAALPTCAFYADGWWRREPDSTWQRVTGDEAAALERSSQQLDAADAAYQQHINREDQP